MKKLYVCYVEHGVDYYGFISGKQALVPAHSFSRAYRFTEEEMDAIDNLLESNGVYNKHWFPV